MASDVTLEAAQNAADVLRSIAQPQRLMILTTLAGNELSVTEIGVRTDIKQPALSQQLGQLRRAGLIDNRRDARQILYRLGDLSGIDSLRLLFGELSADPAVTKVTRNGNGIGHVAETAAAFVMLDRP